jgi:pyridoxamine 5'-phosphate oxidase
VDGEAELRRADLASDPLEQFRAWFAAAASALEVPEAMAIATAAADGAPSVRMVLLKAYDERGLVFYSHYTSR